MTNHRTLEPESTLKITSLHFILQLSKEGDKADSGEKETIYVAI